MFCSVLPSYKDAFILRCCSTRLDTCQTVASSSAYRSSAKIRNVSQSVNQSVIYCTVPPWRMLPYTDIRRLDNLHLRRLAGMERGTNASRSATFTKNYSIQNSCKLSTIIWNGHMPSNEPHRRVDGSCPSRKWQCRSSNAFLRFQHTYSVRLINWGQVFEIEISFAIVSLAQIRQNLLWAPVSLCTIHPHLRHDCSRYVRPEDVNSRKCHFQHPHIEYHRDELDLLRPLFGQLAPRHHCKEN